MPHRPFTLALAGVHLSGNSSPELNINSTSSLIDIDSLSSKLIETVKIPKKENEVNEIIFNSMITPNQNESPESSEENCDEKVNLISQNTKNLIENDMVSFF